MLFINKRSAEALDDKERHNTVIVSVSFLVQHAK